jgi:hypothetical protein
MIKIQDLKLIAFLPEDKENSQLDVAMWHSDANLCEYRDDVGIVGSQCQTLNSIYFGTPDSHEPKFCPRHFFADPCYRLEPVTQHG